MSKPNTTPIHFDGVKFEVRNVGRGSSQSIDSPEQIHLDRISNFKFTEVYVRAKKSKDFVEAKSVDRLVATDLCERMCTLARMVISYSHLVTVWKVVVCGKSNADITTVDKWLTYRVCLGYVIIDEGKRYSKKDPKDNDLSGDDEMRANNLGYTGCGLDDFNKNGERRSPNFKFRNRYSEKAMKLFKVAKFQKDLIQPIREYITMVHEDYMKQCRFVGWKLDALKELKDQPFTDNIDTLPLRFQMSHWELLYNDGKDWDIGTRGKILDTIKQLDIDEVHLHNENPISEKPTTNPSSTVDTPLPSTKKPSHSSTQHPIFPQTPEIAIQLWHTGLSDLPPQAISLCSNPEYELKRRASASETLNEIKKRLAGGELNHLFDRNNDSDSDESVGRPRKKKTKMLRMSASEEKFISFLHSCISMHLGFHAPCHDDKWCYCPFLKTINMKWHQAMGFDSKLDTRFCSTNKSFSPSSLISHVQEKHHDILGIGVVMYLKMLYEGALGEGEFM